MGGARVRGVPEQTVETHGLGLLIALTSSGCLGLPRYIEEGDGDGDGDGDDDVNDVDVDDGTTMRPQDDGPMGSDGMSVDGAASFLLMPDVGMETATTTSVSDVTTDPPPPTSYACQAYSVLVAECYSEEDAQTAYAFCLEYLAYLEQIDSGCISSFEEYVVCLSMLSCPELTGPEPPCEIESQQLEQCMKGG
jgi:hypothetical protein